MLIGVDLVKSPDLLNAAYNDSAGVTAEFNLNMLSHISRRLESDIDTADFSHRAGFNPEHSRMEMHLVSKRAQRINVEGHGFELAEGESIHTESSYKYSIEQFQALAKRAGFVPVQVWTDPKQWFSVHYLAAPG